MAKALSRVIRTSKELRDIINFVRAKYIMAGKRPPATKKITKIIASKIDKEKLLREVKDVLIPL